jgi:DNA-binding transcriptional ArsR family regulator
VEAVLRAIADPRRREIIRLVRFTERSAGDITSHFDVSRPAIPQHLAILREAGLLNERRDGNRRLCRLRRGLLDRPSCRLKADVEKESRER